MFVIQLLYMELWKQICYEFYSYLDLFKILITHRRRWVLPCVFYVEELDVNLCVFCSRIIYPMREQFVWWMKPFTVSRAINSHKRRNAHSTNENTDSLYIYNNFNNIMVYSIVFFKSKHSLSLLRLDASHLRKVFKATTFNLQQKWINIAYIIIIIMCEALCLIISNFRWHRHIIVLLVLSQSTIK